MKRELRYKWKECSHSIDPEKVERLGQDFEISLFEGILERDPNSLPALLSLGELYTKIGRIGDGLAVDRKLAVIFPFEPVVHYNLACSLALSGLREDAVEALRKAVNLGYDDFEAMQNDPDLESVRDHPKFIELLLNAKESDRS
jgi:tetratricopeptide (TPR) repeat protein